MQKVAIHGVPRSGTSWIGELFNSSPNTLYKFQPLFSYAYKDFLTPVSSNKDMEDFFHMLFSDNDDFTNQTKKRVEKLLPTFKKTTITHIVYKEVRYHNILNNLMRKTEDVYLYCIIRNPLSVINSWLQASREFRRDLGWSETEEWRYAPKKNMNKPEEYHGYEKWKEAAYLFLSLKSKYPSRVFIVKYHELLCHPHSLLRCMFDFCGLPFTKQTDAFIYASSSLDSPDEYSVFRKNQVDDKWKDELCPEIIAEILADLQNTDLSEFVKPVRT